MNTTEQESGVSAAVVCTEPLVTLSARADLTGVYSGRKGLHFIALSESMEDEGRRTMIARDMQAAQSERPDARLVAMTATEFDAYLLAPLGVAAFPASAQIFADDVLFKAVDGAAEYDIVVRSHGKHEALIADLRGALRIDAHENEEQRALKINRARVGLCLSPADALTSTEYLLCGVPVVATQEAAERGRYLMPPFCRVVPPDPQAIAAAVDALARIPKPAVRAHVLNLLRMERHNFLIAANKLANEMFGVTDHFKSIEPFAQAWRAQ